MPLALLGWAVAILLSGCQASSGVRDWRSLLASELPRYGHRNIIAVVDAAYPLQVNPGVRTVSTGADHQTAIDEVLNAIVASDHVRAVVWVDAEFSFVSEESAPGAEGLRRALTARLSGFDVRHAPHEDIIRRLDETADLYEVLVLKTTGVIPYSSVFLELECGYWEGTAETALRAAMAKEGARNE